MQLLSYFVLWGALPCAVCWWLCVAGICCFTILSISEYAVSWRQRSENHKLFYIIAQQNLFSIFKSKWIKAMSPCARSRSSWARFSGPPSFNHYLVTITSFSHHEPVYRGLRLTTGDIVTSKEVIMSTCIKASNCLIWIKSHMLRFIVHE